MNPTLSTLTSVYAEHVTMAVKIGKCIPNPTKPQSGSGR